MNQCSCVQKNNGDTVANKQSYLRIVSGKERHGQGRNLPSFNVKAIKIQRFFLIIVQPIYPFYILYLNNWKEKKMTETVRAVCKKIRKSYFHLEGEVIF